MTFDSAESKPRVKAEGCRRRGRVRRTVKILVMKEFTMPWRKERAKRIEE